VCPAPPRPAPPPPRPWPWPWSPERAEPEPERAEPEEPEPAEPEEPERERDPVVFGFTTGAGLRSHARRPRGIGEGFSPFLLALRSCALAHGRSAGTCLHARCALGHAELSRGRRRPVAAPVRRHGTRAARTVLVWSTW
jgi:hypothetical protein